jgi:enoyl-CoA hydratase
MVEVPQYETVKLSHTGPVLFVTLNRPKSLNAVNRTMHFELTDALRFAADDDDSEVVVITGEGRGFCAGGDVKGMAVSETGSNSPLKPTDVRGRHVTDELLWIEKPIIAMINGPAVGLGATIALTCDITVMAEEATIGDRHVNVGLVAGDGGAVVFPALVGINRAKELLMTGRLLSGKAAYEMGLVNHVTPLSELRTLTLEIADELASLPRFAVRATKAAVNKHLKIYIERALDYSLSLEKASLSTEEHRRASQEFANRSRSSRS